MLDRVGAAQLPRGFSIPRPSLNPVVHSEPWFCQEVAEGKQTSDTERLSPAGTRTHTFLQWSMETTAVMAFTAKHGGRSAAIDRSSLGNRCMSELEVMCHWLLEPAWSVGSVALGQLVLSHCWEPSIIYNPSLSPTIPRPSLSFHLSYFFSFPRSIELGQAFFLGFDVSALRCSFNFPLLA